MCNSKRNRQMTTAKLSYHGRARRTATMLLEDPSYMRNRDDEHPWSGLCILRLARQQDTAMQTIIEARAVYAYLAHEDQQNAILRVVSWDCQLLVGKSREDTSSIKIPARFVQIPLSLVQHNGFAHSIPSRHQYACLRIPLRSRSCAHYA